MNTLQVIVIVVVSSAVAYVTTPFVIRFAGALGAVDRPNERKVSTRASMPLLGGLAVALGCAAGMTVALAVCSITDLSRGVAGFAGGALALIAVGVYDDRFDVRPYVKLLFQMLAAGIAIESGFRLDYFTNPFTGDTHTVSLYVAWPISLVWIVGVTNALNLIDGLDGLLTAAGRERDQQDNRDHHHPCGMLTEVQVEFCFLGAKFRSICKACDDHGDAKRTNDR